MNKLLLIALALISFQAQADVYKCVDAKGRSVYQATPCEAASLKSVGTVKKPSDVSGAERERMSAVEKKNKERFADSMDARKKEELAAQAKRDAAYERELKERAAAAEERKADAEERKARAAEIDAMRPYRH